MTDDQQLKPKKKVKIVSLYRPESGSTAINNTHTQSGPVNPVNVNGKRQIYIINAAKVPGVTGTPVILPSGNQPSRCIQLIPQSSPTPNQMLTNEITKQESLQRSSSYMEPTTASPIKAFRSRRDAILNDAQKRMANRHNTGFRPNQSVRSSFFLQKAIKEDESKSEDTSTVVRSRMPVRVHPHPNRKFSVLKYDKKDVQIYSKNEVFLQRENNMDLYPNPIEKKSTGGAGSVFGADRRLKARFRKHGSALQEYSAEKQPLLLTVGKGKIAKHYRGVKEGTLNDSKYFIFTHRSDGGFDAYPVSDWYTVKQGIKTKRLNDEGGEGEFSNGDKVCGKFKIIQNAKPATRSYPVGIEEKLVVSEFDEWKVYDRSDGEVGSGDEESDFKQIIAQKRMEEKRRRRTNKRRGRPAVTRRKHKNNFTVGSDDEDGGPFDMNGEESDIDDYDEYELDYLTDSTSDEENLPEDEREKSYEIQGVDQEVGFISGEEEDDDEEEKEIRENEKKENRLDAQSQQQKQWFSGEVFLDEMEKASSSSSSSGSSDTREDFNAESQKKCSKSSGPSEKFAPPPKRFKTSEIPPPPPSNPPVKSSHEKLFDTIRNYLLRRPITMQELLRKLGAKGLLSSDNTRNTSIVAKILHELKPLQHCFQGKQQFYLRH